MWTLATLILLALTAAQSLVILRQRRALSVANQVDSRHHRPAPTPPPNRETRLLAAAESAGVGLFEWEVPTDHIWLSPGFRAPLGLDENAGRDRASFLNLVHPDDRAALRQAFSQVSRANPEFSVETRFLTPNGSERILALRGHGRFDGPGDGYFSLLVGASLDVTSERLAERKLREQRDELAHLARVATLGELSASLAHELSQPLTTITTNTEVAHRTLQAAPSAPTDAIEALTDILTAIRHANDIVRRMRAEAKKNAAQPEPVAASQLIADTLALLRADLLRRGVTAEARLPSNLPLVLADPTQVRQILVNLVINAADALADFPPIERVVVVRAEARPDADPPALRLTVEDRGPGIPPDRLPLLFKPFQSTKPRGLGLGLSLCRRLAEAQGGTLDLANHSDGKGAIATLQLPIAR